MREEYIMFGFRFVFDMNTVIGKQYRIYKDGKEIGREVFDNEAEIINWAAEHKDA